MTQEQTSFFKNLIRRRVPQIIGLYIAATWMMIEIGDWMIGRFHLSAEITSYIFIGMAMFLPSVIYLAYQYGQPGPDPWKKPTFLIVPTNLVFSVFAMFYFIEPVIATETKTVQDEKGVYKTFEVPKDEYRKNIIGFFWKNKSGDKELDWLQYGLPWLLSKDLDRSLFLSSDTPFDSEYVIKGLQKSGFVKGLKTPKSLQLKLARQGFTQYSLNGEFNFQNQQYELKIELLEALTGERLVELSVKGNDYFRLIDELTLKIKESLNLPRTLKDTSTDMPVAEHTSESELAIRKLVESNVKRFFESDYQSAKVLLEEATLEDFSFAQAYKALARTNLLMGNSREAEQAISKAIQHEYKFTVQDQFLLKGMAYGFRGDYSSQAKVYEMWTDLDENDIEAHEYLARIHTATGIDLAKALNSLMKLRELKPHDDSVLLDISRVFILTKRIDKAIESLKVYVDKNPRDTDGLNQLANAYERDSQFELAKTTYQKILLLDRKHLPTSINLSNLEARLGNFVLAEELLSQLMSNASSPPEKLQIYRGYLTLYDLRGQISKSIEVIDLMADNGAHLPPILQIFQIKFPKSYYLANVGRYQDAELLLDEVREQLQAPLNGIIDAGLVNVYILQKDQDKLQALLDRLDAYLKQYPNPLYNSIVDNANARLKQMQGQSSEAVKLFEKAVNGLESSLVNTQQRDAILQQKVQLAVARIKARDFSTAEKELLDIIEKHPSLAIAFTGLAEVYLEQNEMDKAKQALAKVATLWQSADTEYFEYKNYVEINNRFESLAK